MRDNRTLVFFGIGGALVLALGIVGVSYAHAYGPQPPEDGGHLFRVEGFPGGGIFGRIRSFGATPCRYSLAEAAAEATGLSEDEVNAALRDGQTIAELARAEAVDPQRIVDVAVASHAARLQEALDAGRLTAEQMDQMIEYLETRIRSQLDQTCEPGLFGARRPGGALLERFSTGSWRTAFDAIAEVLGLTPTELFERLHHGQRLDEVAEAEDVELEAIQDALEAARAEAAEEAIQRALEEGRLSEDQAEWMLEGIEKGYVPGGRGFAPGQNWRPRHGSMHGRSGRSRGFRW